MNMGPSSPELEAIELPIEGMHCGACATRLEKVLKNAPGIDGASVKQGFTAYFLESAVLVRKMAEQADQVIAVGHSSKFGKHGFARILPFDGVDVLVTDTGLDKEIQAEMSNAGVHVVKA